MFKKKRVEDFKLEDTRILTKDIVEDILKREDLGISIMKNEKLWFDNNSQEAVRKAGLKYAMSDEELEEYIKCKQSVHYFGEKYCLVKREDGSTGNIKLRSYQKKILDLYNTNRFSILCCSRQTGKCSSSSTILTLKINNNIYKTSIGLLYLQTLSNYRKLTFLEKIKYFLYFLLVKLN